MIDFLNEYWWFSIILYVILKLGDSYLTIVGAKLHTAYAAQHFILQNGYELSPNFEKEVANFQWFNLKHFIFILCGIYFLSFLRLEVGIAIFEFFIGGVLLPLLYINLSHIASILYFQDIRKPGSLKGTIESSSAFATADSFRRFKPGCSF